MNWLLNKKTKLLQSTLVQNSVWGVASNILQILFVSLFFAIVARKYHPNQFAQFLISTTVYQLVAAFSSMGLGQWFIRQYVTEDDKILFTSKFLKTQLGLGILFYLINIALAYVIYSDVQIRFLCIVLGTNIIFDNFINAIRSLNIAENRQRKTANVLVIDGFLKLIVGCLLFITPFSPVILSVLMIVVRIMTLSLFIKLGSSNSISLKFLWHAPISVNDLKLQIVKNWRFVVIGSISIIYWKIGNLIISKSLTLVDVANYETAFRIFSVFQILPVVASATIYPQFIKYVNQQDHNGLKKLYKNIFLLYMLIAVISYVFIFSFSDFIIPLAFGNKYQGAILCLKQMFLTFLLLPTVLLQANLIVALGLEKLDMQFNIVSLIINIAGCFIGLYFIKDLSVINYSVLFSFLVFHVLQDVVLIRKKIMTVGHCVVFYMVLFTTAYVCWQLATGKNPYLFFTAFSVVLIVLSAGLVLFKKKSQSHLVQFDTVLSDNK